MMWQPCAVRCSATLPLHLRNPNRYQKANPGVRGRGSGGGGTKNRTRGGATATRSAAAAIMGKQQAKQLCQRCRAAGRVGQEYADHKGVCPHAVDTTSMTMADAIVVSSESEGASESEGGLVDLDQDLDAGPGPAKRPRRFKGKGKGRA